MKGSPTIMIVDDHREVLHEISRGLSAEGFRITTAADATAARQRLATMEIDLIVLDLMMPDEDGFCFLRELRETHTTPTLFLSVSKSDADRIEGLNIGADDFVSKSAPMAELSARIRAILRRTKFAAGSKGVKPNRYRFDRWSLDVAQRKLVAEDGTRTTLTTTELELLLMFLTTDREVVSRDHILDGLRLRGINVVDKYVEVLISRLRRRLERDPLQPELLITFWRSGYKFTVKPVALT